MTTIEEQNVLSEIKKYQKQKNLYLSLIILFTIMFVACFVLFIIFCSAPLPDSLPERANAEANRKVLKLIFGFSIILITALSLFVLGLLNRKRNQTLEKKEKINKA